MTTTLKYVQIAFPIPIEGVFDYKIPPSLSGQVAVGQRIRAPFGMTKKTGYVLKLAKSTPANHLKEIETILDPKPLITPFLFELATFVSQTYFCSIGEALEAVLPASLQARKRGSASLETALSVIDEKPVTGLKTLLSQEEALRKAIAAQSNEAFLLWNPKEEGTFSFYLSIVEACLENSRPALLLFPEIQRTQAAFRLFQKRFGESVGLWHGALSSIRRYELWLKMQEGEIKILVGTRSAVFCPLAKTGLIIVDSEEDPSYKQEERPRYQTRDVALFRASREKAVILFQSHAPSLETFYRALKGKIRLLKQEPSKQGGSVQVIDLREYKRGKRTILFSKPLERRLDELLQKGGKALLFFNRRGFATFILCRKCGTVFRCPQCQVTFRYHFKSKKLECHYCHRMEEAPEICPHCKGSYVSYSGSGTEKVESELQRILPTARIGRLDLDNTAKQAEREKLLQAFEKGEVDILVGTQLLATTANVPPVDVVGVLSAETQLNRPDFRSAERTFSLFLKLLSRLKEESPFRQFLIQTFYPEHPVFKALASWDHESFYRQEMSSRKELKFPPYYRLARLILAARKEEKAKEASEALKKALKRKKGIVTAGPAPGEPKRRRGFTQWQLLVKSKGDLTASLASALKKCAFPSSIRVTVDIDPQ